VQLDVAAELMNRAVRRSLIALVTSMSARRQAWVRVPGQVRVLIGRSRR
jgi:hypothetical protein